jgi:antitoxin (DNA-binding transcriptional repressor) of toxin-antitoxin stability system
MNIAPLADVKARFSAYIKQLKKAPVIVTKNGRPVAVMRVFRIRRFRADFTGNFTKVSSFVDKRRTAYSINWWNKSDEVWHTIEAETKV